MADQTGKTRRRLRVWGASLVATGAVLLAIGAASRSASAQTITGANPGVVATQAVTPEGLHNGPQGGGDNQCTRDVCKRINWCDAKGGDIKDDAPTVALGKDGRTQDCVKRPIVKKVACCEQGAGSVKVWVTNPNCFKLKVMVTVDNGAPVIKWVGANDTAEFDFGQVKNGNHTIRASVWAGGKKWCNFAKVCFKLKCNSPSPSPSTTSQSPSPSPSASQSASPSPSHSASPSASPSTSKSSAMPPITHTGNNLPVTGPSTGLFVGVGLLLLAGGVGAIVVGRRRFVA